MIHRRNAAIEREKRLCQMNCWGLSGSGRLDWICNSNMCQVTFRVCQTHRGQDNVSFSISALFRLAEGPGHKILGSNCSRTTPNSILGEMAEKLSVRILS